MRVLKFLFLAGSLIALLPVAPVVLAKKVEQVDFPEMLKTEKGDELHLKGAGLRKKKILFINVKVYAMGLYTTKEGAVEGQGVETLLAPSTAKRAELVLVRSVSKGDMIKAVEEGIANNAATGTLPALKPSIDKFISFFRDGDFNDGNRMVLDYGPNRALKVSIQGELRGQIEDPQFSETLFKVWLGEHPVDQDLKVALLGH